MQDALDALERGEEVNLKIPFDDTNEIFQRIDNVEYLACTFDEIDPDDPRHHNTVITPKLKEFLNARRQWCRFGLRNFRLLTHIGSSRLLETIEPDRLSAAYALATPQMIYEVIDTSEVGDIAIKLIETNELFKDVLISTIKIHSEPTTWVDADGNKSSRLSAYLLIYGYNITKSQRLSPEVDGLSVPHVVTVDCRVPTFSIKNQIKFDGSRADFRFSWDSKRLYICKTLINKNVDLDVLSNSVKDYIDNNDYVLIESCIILRNISLDGTEDLIIVGKYVCPERSRNTINRDIEAIMDNLLITHE
jgi:hypothetical protein